MENGRVRTFRLLAPGFYLLMKMSPKLRGRISSIGCECGFDRRNCIHERHRTTMSELVAVSYPDVYRAGEVCVALQRLQQAFSD